MSARFNLVDQIRIHRGNPEIITMQNPQAVPPATEQLYAGVVAQQLQAILRDLLLMQKSLHLATELVRHDIMVLEYLTARRDHTDSNLSSAENPPAG